MQPHIDTVTLAVGDLDRSLAFYRDGLGLATEGIVGEEFAGTETEPAGRAAMFALSSGLTLALYPRSELAKDAGVDGARGPATGPAFSLGHTVGSIQEVHDVLDAVTEAGGSVIGTVGPRPWGIYSGYFADPDGHLWEVVHFPPSDG